MGLLGSNFLSKEERLGLGNGSVVRGLHTNVKKRGWNLRSRVDPGSHPFFQPREGEKGKSGASQLEQD